MARTGKQFASISGDYSTYNYGTWELRSQNKEELTSTIRIRSYFTYTGGGTVSSTYSTFKINGSTVKSGSYSRTKGDYLLGYKDITVKHNEDGSFPNTKISIYASSAHFEATTKSYTLTSSNIPSIEVKSLITSVSSTLFSEDEQFYNGIDLELSLLQGYTTNLSAEVNGSTYDVAQNISLENIRLLLGYRDEPTSENEYKFPLNSTELAQLIPNSTSLNVKLILSTYDGEELIGTSEKTYKFEILGFGMDFDIIGNNDNTTSSLTGDTKSFIKNKSTIKVDVGSVTNYNGATIQKYTFKKTSVDGSSSYESTSPTYTFSTAIQNGDEYWVEILDSRGFSGSSEKIVIGSETYPFIDYTLPFLNSVSIERAEALATWLNFSFSGSFWNENFGIVQNTVHTVYRYKKGNSDTFTEWIEVTPTIDENSITFVGQIGSEDNPILLTTEDAIFEVQIYDELGEDTISNLIVPKSKSMFDWGENYFSWNGELCINDEEVPCFKEVETESTSRTVQLYDSNMNNVYPLQEKVPITISGLPSGSTYTCFYIPSLNMCWCAMYITGKAFATGSRHVIGSIDSQYAPARRTALAIDGLQDYAEVLKASIASGGDITMVTGSAKATADDMYISGWWLIEEVNQFANQQ